MCPERIIARSLAHVPNTNAVSLFSWWTCCGSCFSHVGSFTAWSSAREPTQVFILLETIYHEFDMIAKRRRVFKVEVVGDCYVAVCGLPDPRADHAVVMCKFALECVREMKRLTQDLEVELGPDTTELCLRAGLHSGPVVAGVLRGEKSRFQLFGDTMNTASRMESTGITNRVQISQETADLLIEANKKHWFELRQDKVEAKGKGELTTFLLKSGTSSDLQRPSLGYSSSDENSSAGTSLNSFVEDSQVVDKRNRIAEWTIEILAGLLKEIELRRQALQRNTDGKQVLRRLEQTATFHENGVTVISEVKEIIELPNFDAVAAKREARIDADTITLPDEAFAELRDFVQTVASMYHDNREWPIMTLENAMLSSLSPIVFRVNYSISQFPPCQSCDHECGQASKSYCSTGCGGAQGILA